MAGIAALPLNGRKVLSLFAGGGGSSTGYRMAGYRVIWANEFIPRMQETYRANHPDTILDGRSIRDIDPGAVLKMLNLQPGDLDLLDGSPPCQSFSTAGQRERGWTKVRDYGHGIKQRNDDLFAEYIRFVKEMQPKVFIAENVSGLVKGTAKGTFKEILRSLKECGYMVRAKLLDAQWLGVPQARQRIIFCGVRIDLGLSPIFPKPLPYFYSSGEVLDMRLRNKSYSRNGWTSSEYPFTTILSGGGTMIEWDECNPRKLTIAELKRICSFPDDYVLTGSYAEQWTVCGNAVPPVMMFHMAAAVRDGSFSPLSLQ